MTRETSLPNVSIAGIVEIMIPIAVLEFGKSMWRLILYSRVPSQRPKMTFRRSVGEASHHPSCGPSAPAREQPGEPAGMRQSNLKALRTNAHSTSFGRIDEPLPEMRKHESRRLMHRGVGARKATIYRMSFRRAGASGS